MNEVEAQRFEADPLFAAKVRLRMWDEQAKLPDHEVPGVDAYASLVREQLESP